MYTVPDIQPFKPLADEDKKMLATFTKPDVAIIDLDIPEKDIDSAKYWDTLSAVCRQISKSSAQQDALMPILGRLLSIAKNHPDETFKAKKFETYEEFQAALGEKFGVGRSTCAESKHLFERWGAEQLKDFYMIGRVSFRLLNKAIAPGDESKAYAKKALKKAAECTTEELKTWLEEQNLLGKDETVGATFTVKTSKKRFKEFTRFFESEEVCAYVGSSDKDKILESMIAECEGEWQIRGTEILKEQKKAKEAAEETKEEEQTANA